MKLKIATVFSGIGSFEFALKRMGIDHETLFACDNGERNIEINASNELKRIRNLDNIRDKEEYINKIYSENTKRKNFVEESYKHNYNENTQYFFQDIRLIDGSDFKDKVDIFVGGSPCQSFSIVGSQSGLEDTRGTLFYDYARLIKEIQPKVFIFENVRGLYTHDKGNTWKKIKSVFDELNYSVSDEILNSLDFGVPQNRRRLFVVGFKKKCDFIFPSKVELKYVLNDFREDYVPYKSFVNENSKIKIHFMKSQVDKKYTLSDKVRNYVLKGGTKNFYQKPEIDLKYARTILKTMGNRHRAGIDNYFTVDQNNIRMLTEREALRLMGFTDDFKLCVSRTQAYKQAGNSIVVDVFIALIDSIIKTRVFDEV